MDNVSDGTCEKCDGEGCCPVGQPATTEAIARPGPAKTEMFVTCGSCQGTGRANWASNERVEGSKTAD